MKARPAASPLLKLSIRGKRSRRAKKERTVDGSKPRRGRPMKSASELSTTKKRARREAFYLIKDQKSAMVESDPKTGLCELERLPVELIQQIFFYSLELNLPLASDSLARSLSKESIYSSLILLAYFDDDGKHPVDEKLFAPAQYRFLDCAEKLRLQRSMMKTRWCTLRRLQQKMPALSRLATLQAWHEEWSREAEADRLKSVSLPITPSTDLQAIANLPPLGDWTATEQHFLARSAGKFDDGHDKSRTYLPRIRTWTSSTGKDGQTYKTTDGARGVLNVRHIPGWLLRGSPWTPNALAFLKLMRQGWRFLQNDFVLQMSPTALFDGMGSAISESNTEALKVLLELHFAALQDDDSRTSTTASGRVRYAISFTHPIPPHLFHLATRQRHSAELLALLLREGIGSVHDDDSILTKWALGARHQSGGSEVAEWLLRHMEGTDGYGLNGSSLFVNGNMTWRRASMNYPFPEISFTDELGYLKDGAVDFRPHRHDEP